MSAERLLIVDDEERLLDLLRRYLERRGFRVDTCATSAAAWAQFVANPQAYSLVITDLTLAGITGAELIERMRLRNPALPALITSGYFYAPVLPRVGFLQKPFLPQMLVDAVEAALKA